MSTRQSALIRRSIPVSAQKTRARVEGDSKKSHYRPLAKEFHRDGFTYRQIARENDAAIYQQTWSGCSSNRSVCYEIIRIRRRNGFQIDGRVVEPAEVYPPSKLWGTDGWTVLDKESAFRKLRKLLASSNARPGFGQKRKRSRLEKSPTRRRRKSP